MDKEGFIQEGPISHAYSHILGELFLNNISTSLALEFDNVRKAHDAIHEFMYIAPILFSNQALKKSSWHNKSAFLVYHSESFQCAHSSLIEALCANYNSGFILLRSTIELIIKGAFLECLSHSKYRDNSEVLDANEKGRNLKIELIKQLCQDPGREERLELISGAIFDCIDEIMESPAHQISIRKIISQLDQWGIFDPIHNPEKTIYNEIYGELSSNVHVNPDKTDIGMRVRKQSNELFQQSVDRQALNDYSSILLKTMDAGIVVELNIMRDIVENNLQSRMNLRDRLDDIKLLGLENSYLTANALLDISSNP